jgi:hypothetical protein
VLFRSDETEVAAGWSSTQIEPKTGRTSHCDTSTPWWQKVVHFVAHGVANYFGGAEAAKLTDKGFDAIKNETDKMDGHNLKKWFNEEQHPAIIIWGIAHAQGFVTDAAKKTDKDWPWRHAALESMGITPDTFNGGPDAQVEATLKVALFCFIFGGIGWCYARHIIEAILLGRYAGILPLIPILENRKKQRPKDTKDKNTRAVTTGPYTLETLALLKAAAASLPPAVAPAPLPTVPPAQPQTAAGAGLGESVYSMKHEKWGRVEAIGPCPQGTCYGLRFDDGKAGAALDSEITK